MLKVGELAHFGEQMKTELRSLLERARVHLLVAAALVLLVGAAVVHGVWTDRWGDTGDLEAALKRMDDVPLIAGPWHGKELALDPEQAEQAERVGIARTIRSHYVRTPENDAVSVILMGGRFGPLSVHTPDICYGGAGYVMVGKQVRCEVKREDGSIAKFWTARFHKPYSPGTAPLRIFWGWNAGTGWAAPDSPRFTFRRQPVLFKLYIAREMTSLNDPLEGDPGIPFLRNWLPNLDRALFPQ
jgi:hypothetical protein